MDPTRFDVLVRTLTRPACRRRLGVLAGALLLGSLSRFDPAAARPAHRHRPQVGPADETLKPNGKKCNKDAQCVSGHCCGVAHAQQGVCQDPTTFSPIPTDACDAPDPCDPATCGVGGGKVEAGQSALCCNQDQFNCIKLRGDGNVIEAFCTPQS
jgi:hypothetical protein